MIRHAVRIFGVEVIKAALGPQLRDKQRLSPQHRCGELPAPDEGFGEQMIELLPGPSYIAANGDAVITVGARKSVVEGKSVSVRVDPGGRRIIKKKKKKDK